MLFRSGVIGRRGALLIYGVLIVIGVVIAVSLFIWLKQPSCEKPLEPDPHCLAMVNKDVSYCDNKPDAESIRSCYDAVYMTLALLDDDTEGCGKVGDEDWRNICVAIINEDVSSCDKAKLNSDFCKIVISGQIPPESNEDLKDYALFIIALKNGDRSLAMCDQQKNKNSVDMCKAIFSGDEGDCTQICNVAPAPGSLGKV